MLVLFLAPIETTAESDPIQSVPKLSTPIDCDMGKECFIQNYVDVDPTGKYRDFSCGFLAYDGHKGTDFRLPDQKAMQTGVKVLAAASGTVRAVRDGMPDINVKLISKASIKGREAGNAVVISHGNGWSTQYSHLMRDSISVKPGDVVHKGDPIGLVGLSGNTEFPHVHFTVRHQGSIIDPFTGKQMGSGCSKPGVGLWDETTSKKLAYTPSGVLASGFTNTPPKKKPYSEYIGSKPELATNSNRIIFWVHTFGMQDGDTQLIRIIRPDGSELVSRKNIVKANLARHFLSVGAMRKETTWPAGEYHGEYLLQRFTGDGSKNVIKHTITVTLSPTAN